MFPTTSWTLVLRAADPDACHSALEALCANYWAPVYTFVKRQVGNPADAEDLTQAFFARLLEKHDLLRRHLHHPVPHRFQTNLLQFRIKRS